VDAFLKILSAIAKFEIMTEQKSEKHFDTSLFFVTIAEAILVPNHLAKLLLSIPKTGIRLVTVR